MATAGDALGSSYWWSNDPIPSIAARSDVCFADIRRRRPLEPLMLAVIGDLHRFKASVLFKTASRTGVYEVVSFDDATAEILNARDTRIIRWAPRGEKITDAQRKRIPAGKSVINDTHLNVDKSNVQAVFEKVSSRSLRVDPRTFKGIAVVKSERNAEHDGAVIRLPIDKPRRHFVYERLIDNTVFDDLVFDIRIPVIMGDIPLAYIKLRKREARFENENYAVSLFSPADVLSSDELELCRAFCRELGLEYGELDVLRDRVDNEIYIVDANNTPAGPPNGLPEEPRQTALRLMAASVATQFFGMRY